jgi:DNA polymerase-3 subunit delta'
MKFEDVIGQNEIKQQLLQSVAENRVSHALMFLGPQGCGSLPMALAFARLVHCENPSPTEACGVCHSCLKHAKNIHPDMHFVFPVITAGSGKLSVSDNHIKEWRDMLTNNVWFDYNQWMIKIGAANKQGGIYTDESAEILRKLSLKTYEADYKIMLIWLPEKMRIETSNKLLKILEEPPAKTLFLLVSEDTSSILPTILSRCQTIKFKPIKVAEIENALISRFDVNAENAKTAARLSGGSMVKALEAMQTSEEEQFFFEQFTMLMRLSFAFRVKELLELGEKFSTLGRERQKSFLLYALRQVRENFVLHFSQPELSYQTPSENDFSKKFYLFINERNVEHLANAFSTAAYHIEANANPNILFFDLSIKLYRMLKM